jgi:hypothetical protein
LIAAAIVAGGLLAVGRPAIASEFVYGCGREQNCCSQTPRLEDFGGCSLFWHDPCSCPSCGWVGERFCHTASAPQVYGKVDFLPLFRDQSGSIPYQVMASEQVELIRDQNGNVVDTVITYPREAVLSSSDFAADFAPGVRTLLGLSLSDWYRVEFSYLGLYSWSDSMSVRYDANDGTGNLLSPFSSFGDLQGRPGLDPLADGDFQPVEGWDFNELATISYRSRLDSAELNVRRRVDMLTGPHPCGETSCLVGLRYLKVREEFNYFTRSPLPDPDGSENSVAVRTDNDLFGVQVGTLMQFLVHNRAWIDLEIKGALLLNQAENRVDSNVNAFVNGALTPRQRSLRDREDCAAFLGDLSLQFNYQFAPSWTFRAGYNAMWLSGAALASDNFSGSADTLIYGPAFIDHGGNVVYHGANIGITWAR